MTVVEVTDEMLERAMTWRQRIDTPEWAPEDEAELEVWLQADERHARAFERTGQVWAFFDQHATSPELIGARRALLGRVQRQTRGRWTGPAAILRMPTRRAAASAIAAVLVASAGVGWMASQGEVYSTGLGERRVITLDDGSVVTLDARSKVGVRYSRDARRLVLRQGQARFDVAHDPSRPFTVTARDRNVVATGTAFNIDMVERQVRVTLIEGRVLVMPTEPRLPFVESRAATRPVELHPGQAMVSAKDAPPKLVRAADIDQATAWQEGKLMFDRQPLAEAVERVNRYSDRKITIADPQAAAVQVSGVFNTGDVNAFLEAVNGFLPVRVVQGPDGVILRSTGTDGQD